MLYHDRHSGIGLKEAKDAIDMIEAKMKVRRDLATKQNNATTKVVRRFI